MNRMYDFSVDEALPKPERYRQLIDAAGALVDGERDGVANMANVAALMWDFLPDINWAGFYRVDPEGEGRELVLGPFAGKPACIRIPFGVGVCGTAAATGETQLIEDVEAFPGHIACDAASKSELVVPVQRDGRLIAVIDIDSPHLARFDREDAAGIEALAARICAAI